MPFTSEIRLNDHTSASRSAQTRINIVNPRYRNGFYLFRFIIIFFFCFLFSRRERVIRAVSLPRSRPRAEFNGTYRGNWYIWPLRSLLTRFFSTTYVRITREEKYLVIILLVRLLVSSSFFFNEFFIFRQGNKIE